MHLIIRCDDDELMQQGRSAHAPTQGCKQQWQSSVAYDIVVGRNEDCRDGASGPCGMATVTKSSSYPSKCCRNEANDERWQEIDGNCRRRHTLALALALDVRRELRGDRSGRAHAAFPAAIKMIDRGADARKLACALLT